MRVRLPVAPIFLAILALLAGCAKRETDAAAGGRAASLLVGNSAEPGDLDPHLASILSDQFIVNVLFEGLTILDERSTQPLPGAAESWTASADGLVWTFRLREGLKWSNGEPLVAADFLAAWRRVLNPEFASDNAWYLFAAKNAEAYNAKKTSDFGAVGFAAPDPRTVVITLERPAPYLPALVSLPAWFPVNPRVIAKFGPLEKRGTDWTRPGNLVGNGAFVLKEWSPNARIVAAKNPHFREAASNRLAEVVFFPIESPDIEEKNFRAGQLHVTSNLPVTKIATWRERDPAALRLEPTLQANFLRFNTTRAPFTDPRVRRALSLAIDREALSRAVFQGSRLPAVALTPPGTGGYTAKAAVPHDVAAAKRLLAAAGFPDGKNLPVLDLQCRNDEISPRLAEALQGMWQRDLGVRVAISQLEQKTWIQNQQSLNYSATIAAWTADFPDPVTFLGLFTGASGYNWTGWKNADYDRLMDAAAATADGAKRYDLFQQAEAVLLEDAPVAPVYVGARTYLIAPAVKGWEPAPLVFRRLQIVRLEN